MFDIYIHVSNAYITPIRALKEGHLMTNLDTVTVQNKKTVNVVEKLGKTSLITGVVGVTSAVMASSANAALDVTSLTTEIGSNSDSMQTVMLAVLTLVALFVGYRMIKRSMS